MFNKNLIPVTLIILSYFLGLQKALSVTPHEGVVIDIFPKYTSENKLDLKLIDNKFNSNSKIQITKARASIPMFSPFFESCILRFLAGTFRMSDIDKNGKLLTANALGDFGFGFYCENYLPYIQASYMRAPLFDLFITDDAQTDIEHRYKGDVTSFELSGGFRISGLFRLYFTLLKTDFNFSLGKQQIDYKGIGLGLEF